MDKVELCGIVLREGDRFVARTNWPSGIGQGRTRIETQQAALAEVARRYASRNNIPTLQSLAVLADDITLPENQRLVVDAVMEQRGTLSGGSYCIEAVFYRPGLKLQSVSHRSASM